MEVRHISKQLNQDVEEWLSNSEKFCLINVDYVQSYHNTYKLLITQGNTLKEQINLLKSAVSTPKAKNSKENLIRQIDDTLQTIESSYIDFLKDSPEISANIIAEIERKKTLNKLK